MSNALFPQLKGLVWEYKFSDEFFNLVQPAAAPGFETRLNLGPDPIIHFELNYNYLRQAGFSAATPYDELALIRGFFRARMGDFDSFLLYLPDLTLNPNDGSIVGQALTPDGNNVAPLIYSNEGYDENIYEAFGVNGDPGTAPVVYSNGTPLTFPTDYIFVGPGAAISGTTYPGLAIQFIASTTGDTITADFSWYYRCRFEQGTQEWDGFLALLYSAQQMKLIVTRTS